MRWFQRRINKAATDERLQFYTYKAGYYAFNWMMIVILITALIAGYLKEDGGIIGMIGMWLAVFGGSGVFVYNQKKYQVDATTGRNDWKNPGSAPGQNPHCTLVCGNFVQRSAAYAVSSGYNP